MAYKYIDYSFEVSYMIQKMLVWMSDNTNIYFATRKNATDSWSYYAGNASHALLTGRVMTLYATEASAQANYLTTDIDSDGKFLAVLPSSMPYKYVRLYVEEGHSIIIREFRPSTFLSASEIIAGTLDMTDALTNAPLIRVIKGGVTRIKIGNVAATKYGIAGYDSSSNTVFELSQTTRQIAGWDFNASQLTKNNMIISSGGRVKLGTGSNVVAMSSQDSKYRLWAGDNSALLAPFKVTMVGTVFANEFRLQGVALSATTNAAAEIFFASGRKLWIYENAAPTGWTTVSVTDVLVAVKGGTHGYNVSGGTVTATWTQPDHTLTTTEIPSHRHSLTYPYGSTGFQPGGFLQDSVVNPGPFYSDYSGGGAAHNHGILYRPKAAMGIIIQKT